MWRLYVGGESVLGMNVSKYSRFSTIIFSKLSTANKSLTLLGWALTIFLLLNSNGFHLPDREHESKHGESCQEFSGQVRSEETWERLLLGKRRSRPFLKQGRDKRMVEAKLNSLTVFRNCTHVLPFVNCNSSSFFGKKNTVVSAD